MAFVIKDPSQHIDACRHLRGLLRTAAAVLNLQPRVSHADDARSIALCEACYAQTVTAFERMIR